MPQIIHRHVGKTPLRLKEVLFQIALKSAVSMNSHCSEEQKRAETSLKLEFIEGGFFKVITQPVQPDENMPLFI